MANNFPPNWENLEASLRDDVETAIVALLAVVGALNTLSARTDADINANPAAAIKQVATGVKVCCRQTLRLARLRAGAFDTGDTGT
jgi:hypothetical protein